MASKAGVFRERKDCVLRVRVTRREKELLQELAKHYGKTVSELVRFAIHKYIRDESPAKRLARIIW